MAEGTIGLSQPAASTITLSLRTKTFDLGGSTLHEEVIVLGDANSSAAVGAITNTAPESTRYGLNVRIVSGPSTANDLVARVNQGVGNSSAADRWRANIANSSAADYSPVRLVNSSGDGYAPLATDYTHDSTLTASTVAAPSVMLRASATAPTAVSGDDRFVVQWGLRSGAAVAALTDGNGAIAQTSSNAPTSNAIGLVVRPALGGLQTYAASTTGQATVTTIVSSAAGSKAFVYGYTITSTASTGVVAAGFYDGATLKWPVKLSSGFAGANLAVSPPGFIFAGTTGAALTFNVESSVTGGMTVGIAYWLST